MTEFKQMHESAKEREKKNNNDDIRNSLENQKQNDKNNIINFEEYQINISQRIDLNNNKNNIIKEEIKINKNEEGDQNDIIKENYINNKLKEKNINTEEIKIDKEKEKKIEEVIQQDNNINIMNFEKENQNLNTKNSTIKEKIGIKKNTEENIINNDIIDENNNIDDRINEELQINTSNGKNLNGQIKNEHKFNPNNINNNSNSDNPYTLSAVLGIFLPVIPSVIFGVKIYNKQQKFTGGDIALIIVGLFPIISAIVFGIMAYKYNQTNLDSEIPKNLKDTGNINKNNINQEENNINREDEINPIRSIVSGAQGQSQEEKGNI